jgi:hypothetical protein
MNYPPALAGGQLTEWLVAENATAAHLFNFDEPHNGFYGFDKEYFKERVKEDLQGEIDRLD